MNLNDFITMTNKEIVNSLKSIHAKLDALADDDDESETGFHINLDGVFDDQEES